MATFENGFKRAKELVSDFKANEQYYLSSKYSEAEARVDYINKFFVALGWDVRHKEQKNPYEQEVKVEKGVKVGKTQKRADYAFHLAPNFRDPVFFVEAKKPARALSNADDYFQAIRYGWNANTPIVILTDFEEFHIIDSRFKPDIDTALNKKLLYFHYSQYADKEKFAEIYHLFSREAVENNAIEKYAEALPKPKGKARQKQLFPGGCQSIDESFLEEIDEIRMTLARAFKKSNPALQGYELTEAAHRTIDRLVFIRFLEDKLIEQEHYISEFGENNNAWHDFVALSRQLNAKYNGVVFKHHFIDDTGFNVTDTVFSNICEELSHLNSPYDFDKIPIHILGSIYERFLGKVVHATAKKVTIEEKPEVKKAGGVYYTPQYIVRYIVANTITKLIEGKSPLQISKLRFADIACGSGSFLIAVFDTLLHYHNNWYQHNPAKAKTDGCFHQDGKWILSLKQKKNILLNNIYGVDIDPQAVEVTQLSLSLKLMEDESTATANEMQVLFHEKILPDLTKNIICGNSLIGWDIENNELFPDEETHKLNPMNFENAFPHIFTSSPLKGEGAERQGDVGFDAIVGNPPYVRQEGLKDIKEYFSRKYIDVYNGTADLYVYFINKGMELLKEKGKFGYIVSDKFIHAGYGKKLRSYLTKKFKIIQYIDKFEKKVFPGVGVDPCIITINKERAQAKHNIKFNSTEKVLQDSLSDEGWSFATSEILSINKKIEGTGKKIKDWQNVNIYFGIKPGLSEAFIIDEKYKNQLISKDSANARIFKPLLRGRDIKRYQIEWEKLYLIDARIGTDITKYPKIYQHFDKFKAKLLKRTDFKKDAMQWYHLRPCKYYDELEKPKIIYPDISNIGGFYWDDKDYYFNNTVYMITNASKYWIALLNSKLLSWYYKQIASGLGDEGVRYFKQFVELIPIIEPIIKMQKKLETLVNQMLESKKKLATAKMDRDINYYQRKCSNLDREINIEVYKLYGLTEDEIKIVEAN